MSATAKGPMMGAHFPEVHPEPTLMPGGFAAKQLQIMELQRRRDYLDGVVKRLEAAKGEMRWQTPAVQTGCPNSLPLREPWLQPYTTTKEGPAASETQHPMIDAASAAAAVRLANGDGNRYHAILTALEAGQSLKSIELQLYGLSG